MGAMRTKRRKKLARKWAELQSRHNLSDAEVKRARFTGYPPERIEEMLGEGELQDGASASTKIQEICCRREEELERRKKAIESGEIKPKPKKKKVKVQQHDPMWAKAKEVCRLNMEDIRKAKELGLRPRTLIKNVPNSNQRWKAPVKIWIQNLFEERQVRQRAKMQSKDSSDAAPASEPHRGD